MNALAELASADRSVEAENHYFKESTDDDDMDLAGTKFNVLNHVLVPHQELVPVESEEEELAPGSADNRFRNRWSRLAKELLPKILITDPVVQVIKETTERAHDAASTDDEEHVLYPQDGSQTVYSR